jgi:hypothetical protein
LSGGQRNATASEIRCRRAQIWSAETFRTRLQLSQLAPKVAALRGASQGEGDAWVQWSGLATLLAEVSTTLDLVATGLVKLAAGS